MCSAPAWRPSPPTSSRLTAQAVELPAACRRESACSGARASAMQTGVLSFVVEGMDCEELGEAHGRGRAWPCGRVCTARRWPTAQWER